MTDEQRPAHAEPTRQATIEDVRDICGRHIDNGTAADILALSPTVEELEEAAAWLGGESDVMGKSRKPLSGTVGRIFELLEATVAPGEEG